MTGRQLRAAVLVVLTGCATVTDTRGKLLASQVETDDCEAELRGAYAPGLAPMVAVIVKRHVTCRKITANTWQVVHHQQAGPGLKFGLSAIATVVTGVLAFFALGLALAQSSQSMQPNGGGEQAMHDSEGGVIVLAGAGALALAAGTIAYAGTGYVSSTETTTEDVDRVIDGTVSRDESFDATLSYGIGKQVALRGSIASLDVSALNNADFWVGKQFVVFDEELPLEQLTATSVKCAALAHTEPAIAAQYDADACRKAGWALPEPWVAWCKESSCLHGAVP